MTPASLTQTAEIMEVDERELNSEEPRKLKLDETRIFFIPPPGCTTQSLFHDFSRFGWLDYVYAAKSRTGNGWFGYARYIYDRDAKAALMSRELAGYHCKQGRRALPTRREEEDSNFQRFSFCGNCFINVETKTIARHYDICELQRIILDGNNFGTTNNGHGVYVSHGLTYQTADTSVSLQGDLHVGDSFGHDVPMVNIDSLTH